MMSYMLILIQLVSLVILIDFSKSPIQATYEGMVTFGTTVTQGYLDVPVSDFSSLTGHLPLSIKYIFEHVEDYLLGDRHPTE